MTNKIPAKVSFLKNSKEKFSLLMIPYPTIGINRNKFVSFIATEIPAIKPIKHKLAKVISDVLLFFSARK